MASATRLVAVPSLKYLCSQLIYSLEASDAAIDWRGPDVPADVQDLIKACRPRFACLQGHIDQPLGSIKHVRVWSGTDFHAPSGYTATVVPDVTLETICALPDGQHIALGRASGCGVFNLLTGAVVRWWPVNGTVWTVTWASRAGVLCYVAGNHCVCVDVTSPTARPAVFAAASETISWTAGCCGSPGAPFDVFFVGSSQGLISAYPVPDTRAQETQSSKAEPLWTTPSVHASFAVDMRVTPDHQRLITCGTDSKAVILDPRTGARVRTLACHTNTVWQILPYSDNERVLLLSADRSISIWNINTGAMISRIHKVSTAWVGTAVELTLDQVKSILVIMYEGRFSTQSQAVQYTLDGERIRSWTSKECCRVRKHAIPLPPLRSSMVPPLHATADMSGLNVMQADQRTAMRLKDPSPQAELPAGDALPPALAQLALAGDDAVQDNVVKHAAAATARMLSPIEARTLFQDPGLPQDRAAAVSASQAPLRRRRHSRRHSRHRVSRGGGRDGNAAAPAGDGCETITRSHRRVAGDAALSMRQPATSTTNTTTSTSSSTFSRTTTTATATTTPATTATSSSRSHAAMPVQSKRSAAVRTARYDQGMQPERTPHTRRAVGRHRVAKQ